MTELIITSNEKFMLTDFYYQKTVDESELKQHFLRMVLGLMK